MIALAREPQIYYDDYIPDPNAKEILKSYQIQYHADLDCFTLGPLTLKDGDILAVLVMRECEARWVKCQLIQRSQSKKWDLLGLPDDIQIEGLWARSKRKPSMK